MKYSIITINYNNKQGLKNTIESVIHQTHRDFEYIVIDGGSTDGSADILKEYDSHIDYWVSEPDKGIYNAMNKGIAKAKGDYLNFMNSGDCFFDYNVLQRVTDYGYHTDFIVGRDLHVNETSGLSHVSIQPSRLSMMHFFIATLDHQSSFIRRELFKDSLYREDFRLVSDWIFFMQKIVSEGCQVQFIPDIICRREEGGISEQQQITNKKEISHWLHNYLPKGVYDDYTILSNLDRTSLDRLFNIIENKRQRRWLINAIKLINKFL